MNNASTGNNAIVARLFESLQNPKTAQASLSQEVGKHFAWHGPKPFKSCFTPDEWCSSSWLPLIDAFSGLSREAHMLVG